MTIPEKFKAVRVALGLKRNKFAAKLGIAASYVTHIENGERDPGDRVVNLLYSEAGVSREWFEAGKGEMFADKEASLQKSLTNEETALVNTYRQLADADKKVLTSLALMLTRQGPL